jgi:phospho-N-acetylmuramoyl-pentapeptide-transferase
MVSFFVTKILFLGTVSFLIAFLWAPVLIRFLNRYGLGKNIRTKEEAPVFAGLHEKKVGTPTMGGILVWGTTLITVALFFLLDFFSNNEALSGFNFLSRKETWLPLAALIASALVGLIDDFFNVRKIGAGGGGLRMRHRLLIYSIIAAVGAWWFFYKLEWDFLHIPFVGPVFIGPWYIPLFFLVIIATSLSVNETDGLDGLAGGTLLTSFTAFGAIAFLQGKYDLATLCAVIAGALLAFLWFNINPARFFMGDTGAMGLGVALGVIAMLTNAALILPIIGFVFVLESLSVIIQVFSKKIRHKKVFLSSPIHHHLEAKGWTEPQIVMRFWMISGVAAVIGVIVALVDKAI